ncbi:uncharacterized protein J3R85_019294 [Psidium guajava]|nr:uncharacterized protein J3R85_019294 [Psidium guajava]
MGRRKLPLELIPNEKARRITYEKRKKCMMKKAQEFSTLCGVDTCMIIYGPAGSAAANKPEIWPASPEKVKRIFRRYISEAGAAVPRGRSGCPSSSRTRSGKVDAELARPGWANWEAKYPISEALIEELSKVDPRRLHSSLGQKLDAAKARLAVVKEDAMRRPSHMNDHHVHAGDHIDDRRHMRGLFQDHCLAGDVPPWGKLPLHHPGGVDALGNAAVPPSLATCRWKVLRISRRATVRSR